MRNDIVLNLMKRSVTRFYPVKYKDISVVYFCEGWGICWATLKANNTYYALVYKDDSHEILLQKIGR